LNHDGKLDLAVTNGNTVAIFLGNGDGTFTAPVQYAATQGNYSIAIADVDGDGNPDLVIGGAGVCVLLGKGNGTFWGPQIYSIQGTASQVQVADLDGDGKLDIAATSDYVDSQLDVLRGRGYGTFDLYETYFVGPGAQGLAMADFDGDGSPDVVVTNTTYAGNTVTVLLNRPAIALFPAALSFQPQKVGTTSQPKADLVSNPGSTRLQLKSISIVGRDASDFRETTTCKTKLSVGRNCTIDVTFRPSLKGTRTAELKIDDDALGRTQRIALRGIGK
jgi:hypothetical protein